MSSESAPLVRKNPGFTTTRTLIALIAAACAFAATLALGNWQLRRAEQKLSIEQAWTQAETAQPVEVSAAVVSKVPERLPMRVRLQGRFLHDKTVWLDNRQMNGRVGFFVVTPLALANQTGTVLVMRGWAPRDLADRARLPPIGQPTDIVTLEGLALADAPRLFELGDPAPTTTLPAIWQNLDRDAFARVSGLSTAPFVVQQTSPLEDRLQRHWSRPASGVEKHRGYAVQWFGLAALIVILTLWFGLRPWLRGRASARAQ